VETIDRVLRNRHLQDCLRAHLVGRQQLLAAERFAREIPQVVDEFEP